MDYQKFYAEVVEWIMQVNQKATQFGMDSQDFWKWVMTSVSEFEVRYNKNKLVINQMVMLIEWLEEIYFERKNGASKEA
ncbi:hypothetical protein [Paraliobacillus sp. X-1268]|uniref:hypothetical protein n=1 Tax=Paraliobacillus sp. X-1268 TaxID=2213193 RepID=UPI000E3D068F|nr:hypothetical protein [Paraliobacillus sp. X-1268]